jgi:hypothetical protein
MEPKTKVIEVRTGEGKLIVSFYVTERAVNSENRPTNQGNPGNTNRNEKKGESNQGNSSPKDESLMTDAQKRYLFRILADQGIDGDGAYEHLKQLFGAATLKEVGKFEASKMIERLLGETQGGAVYD